MIRGGEIRVENRISNISIANVSKIDREIKKWFSIQFRFDFNFNFA